MSLRRRAGELDAADQALLRLPLPLLEGEGLGFVALVVGPSCPVQTVTPPSRDLPNLVHRRVEEVAVVAMQGIVKQDSVHYEYRFCGRDCYIGAIRLSEDKGICNSCVTGPYEI